MKKIRKAVFPIAGLGTRLFPATKTFPKEMLPLVDKPLIQYAIEEALSSGIEEFIFVINQKQPHIQDYFNNYPNLFSTGNIHYVHQEKPLGLGHAILCARHFIQEESFAILLSDDFILSEKPCLQQMIEAYEKIDGNMVAIHPVSRAEVSQYGIIKGEKLRGSTLIKIDAVIEKPPQEKAPSCLAIIGRYLLNPRILYFLENQKLGTGGEIQLTDSFVPLLQEQPFYGFEFEGQRFDCGSKKGYLAATLKLALEQQDVKEEIERFLEKEGFSREITKKENIL